MKQLTRWASCLLALALCLTMAACAGPAPAPTEPPETTLPPATLPTEPTEPPKPTEPPVPVEKVLVLSLNVMYNDTVLGYFSNENGPVIEVREDGQYTLTFDCAQDLSENARGAGVEGLNNLTAIYIKDYKVTTREQSKSPVTACDIRWDEITVNGQSLTITNGEFKPALKANGVFDTNDPFNAWDGSAVEEVTTDTETHFLNINIDDPQTVSVTFTITGLTFAD